MSAKKQKQEQRNTPKQQAVKIHSYYTLPSRGAARPELDTTKRGTTAKKRPHFRINRSKVLTFMTAAALIVVALYSLRLSSTPVIIVDSSPALGRSEAYQSGIQQILSSNLLNRTKITFQRESFLSSVQQEYPEIESLSVTTPLLGARPVVHIKESRVPFRLEANAVPFLINDSGVVIGQQDDFTISQRLISIRDESGIEIQRGVRVLRSDDAEFFSRVDKLLSAKGRALTTIRITSVPREAYLVLKDTPYTLRVYLDDNADTQMASFFSAEKTLGERGEAPVSYMDLRAGEKVYWQ